MNIKNFLCDENIFFILSVFFSFFFPSGWYGSRYSIMDQVKFVEYVDPYIPIVSVSSIFLVFL